MTLIQAIILGAIQGLTEFLPVSSSGHLAICKNLFNFNMDMGLLYVGVDMLHLSDMPVKIAVNIIVIIVNYVLSKLLVFGKNGNKGE